MARVAARVARLERARAALADSIVVVLSYLDSASEDVARQVAEGRATGATVVVIDCLAPQPRGTEPLPPG